VPKVVPKCAFSETGDGAEREVVHDHPHHGDVLLERGGEDRRVLAEAAVADQRDDHAIGTGDLGAERGGAPEASSRSRPA
jgi:hypothetical protein